MNTPVVKPSPQKPTPLGRGLSALFGDADASYQPAAVRHNVPASVVAPVTGETTPPPKASALQKIPVTWLRSGMFQPRQHFNESSLQELAESIREHGILEPILVRRLSSGSQSHDYEIIAGERRWRAAQIAGLHDVPVLIRELSDREALEFGIIENVQREDLSALEEGEGYARLMTEFSHTQEALAKIVGKSRPHIANMMRLLTLPEQVKQLIAQGKLSAAHGRALVTAKNQVALAQEIVKKGLNLRQTELLAKRDQENPQIHKRKPRVGESADIIALEKELERMVGLRIQIAPTSKSGGKAGTLTLHYTNLDQFDDVIKRLKG